MSSPEHPSSAEPFSTYGRVVHAELAHQMASYADPAETVLKQARHVAGISLHRLVNTTLEAPGVTLSEIIAAGPGVDMGEVVRMKAAKLTQEQTQRYQEDSDRVNDFVIAAHYRALLGRHDYESGRDDSARVHAIDASSLREPTFQDIILKRRNHMTPIGDQAVSELVAADYSAARTAFLTLEGARYSLDSVGVLRDANVMPEPGSR